jgi:hypothetical protein
MQPDLPAPLQELYFLGIWKNQVNRILSHYTPPPVHTSISFADLVELYALTPKWNKPNANMHEHCNYGKKYASAWLYRQYSQGGYMMIGNSI